MECIIIRLDKEGVNLQETRLNLINQGYKFYWDFWNKSLFNKALNELTLQIAKEELTKGGLL